MNERVGMFFAKVILIFGVFYLFAHFFGPLPLSVNSVNTTKTDTFSVSGTGKYSAAPDLALTTVGVTAQAQTVSQAQDQINKNINKITEAIKALGIDSKDIQTQNYSINPDYDYSSGNQHITGYNANTNLVIKVRDLAKINSVIDAATQNGANQIGGVSFDLSDPTDAQNQARQMAVNEAKDKAQQAATVAGFKLGKIINYSEDFGGSVPRPLMYDTAKAETSSVAPTQIEPGSTQVQVSVTLSFEIN